MNSSTRNGLTLIEVVAGLALMGTLMTMVLVTGSKHLRQIKSANEKVEASDRLDDFLATWSTTEFSTDGVSKAAERAGVDVTGDFGFFDVGDGLNSRGNESDSVASGRTAKFAVRIRRSRRSSLPNATVVRLAMVARSPNGRSHDVTWAEILVNEQ